MYQKVDFGGAPGTYGVKGAYKWGGPKTCGIDASTTELTCSYTLVPNKKLAYDPSYVETGGVRKVGSSLSAFGGKAAGLMAGIKDEGAYYGA